MYYLHKASKEIQKSALKEYKIKKWGKVKKAKKSKELQQGSEMVKNYLH